MASKIDELSATLNIERSERARERDLLKKQIEDLQSAKQSLETQVRIATKGEGVPSELQQDIEWRVRCGLRRDQAEDVARRQWDERLKAEAAKVAASAPKISPEQKRGEITPP